MEYSIFRITLDIHRHQSQVSIPVMYGDTAVRLLVTLSDGGVPYIIGRSCWAQFVANKPDKSEPLLRKCIIENGTTIRFDFDDGIADVAGVYDCEIRLYGAEGKLTSPCFTMVVDPRVVADYVGDDMAAPGFIDQIGTTMAAFQVAEGKRDSAEQERETAEEERQKAEQERESAELAREKAEQKREAAEKERNDSIEKFKKKYDYHTQISEEDKTGYIAFDLHGGAIVDILVRYLRDVETDISTLFRITCADSTFHWQHKLNVEMGKDYPTYVRSEPWITGSTWYIPFTFAEYDYNGTTAVDIYAKGVMDNIDYDLNVRFVETLPEDAEPISPTSYATKEEIGDINGEIDKIKSGVNKLKYKEILTIRDEKYYNTSGYIALKTYGMTYLEVAILTELWGEHDTAYLQLSCRSQAPYNHTILGSVGISDVYVNHTDMYGECIWYIPVYHYNYTRVSVKDIFYDGTVSVTAEWVTDIDTSELEKVTHQYALPNDCKFDMLTESRDDKPLGVGTWICTHTGGLDGFKLLNRNGNNISAAQGVVPAFEFGILTISVPWLDSYWHAFDPEKSGYNKRHCSLIAKVGNDMKCYYWEDSGNGTYYLRDISTSGNGMCWKIR